MKKCPICDSTYSIMSGITCSKKCGMIYRYLNKQSNEDSQYFYNSEIYQNYNSILSIPALYHLFKLTKNEPPKCVICNSTIVKFKQKFSETCSKTCAKRYTIIKKELSIKEKYNKRCEFCGNNLNGKSHQSCTKQLQQIKKFNIDKAVYLNNFIGLECIDKLVLLFNGYTDLNKPRCVVCLKEHTKVNKRIISKTCSNKCSMLFNPKKPLRKEVFEYTKNIKDISVFKRFDIFNNYELKECLTCSKHFSSKGTIYCSSNCSRLSNMKNLKDLNVKYVQSNFIKQNIFDMNEFCDYFNASYTFGLRYKERENITEQNYFSTEYSIFIELSKLLSKKGKMNDRTIIKPKEIDMLFDEFGIEYNGLMWHSFGNSDSELFNNLNKLEENKYYHLRKTEDMEANGYRLFHIFENEWKNPRTQRIWKNILYDYVFKSKQIDGIIKAVPYSDAISFINQHHLIEGITSDLFLGSYTNDSIISIMSFNKLISGYELIQYCSISNKNNYKEILNCVSNEIITKIDRRYDDGSILLALGFKIEHYSEPNSWFFSSKCVKKSGLVQTDEQTVSTDRIIFDCGTISLKLTQ